MTDPNLDGLPNLLTLQMHADSGCEASSRLLRELRQLVERERKAAWDEACDAGAAVYRAEYEYRLPAWAKPVMRAARRWEAEYGSEELTPAEHDLANALFRLTEAQRKEIGE